jgi:hypothetical protein
MSVHRQWDRRPQLVRRIIAAVRVALVTTCLLAFALVVLVMGALHLPSFWLEPVVASVSGGLVRFNATGGAVGDGQGELWVRSETGANWRPWMPLRWSLSPVLASDPLTGGAAIAFTTNRGAAFASWQGVSLLKMNLSLPPGLLLGSISHPLARAQWLGDIRLTADQVICHWRAKGWIQRCEGSIELIWFGVSSPIFPIEEFGDYRLLIDARQAANPSLQARISTINGMLRLTGTFDATGGETQYRIQIEGEPAKINGLENIIGPGLKRMAQPGHYFLEKK